MASTPPEDPLYWAGESQVPFGDKGALMRGNSKVRALCPEG